MRTVCLLFLSSALFSAILVHCFVTPLYAENSNRAQVEQYGVTTGIIVDTASSRKENRSLLSSHQLNKSVRKPHETAFCSVIDAKNQSVFEWRSGEFLVDSNVLYVPAGGDQVEPAMAFGDANYLAVWIDGRAGHGIFGARIDPSGILLDSAGIVITSSEGMKSFHSVAFNGTTYLVVWDDSRNFPDRDIYGARITESGVVLDPDGFVISAAYDWQCDPAVASDGTHFFVVWADFRDNPQETDLYGARVSSSGVVLDTHGIPLITADGMQGDHSIVFDGTNYFVVWDDERNYATSGFDVYGARITQEGEILDSTGISISVEENDQGCPVVAFDDENYFVAWKDKRSGLYEIYGARVTQGGEVLDTAGILIHCTYDDWQWIMSVAYDGINYFVVWQDWIDEYNEFDICGARISTSGEVLDTAGVFISDTVSWQYNPAVAFDGANYLVIWGDLRSHQSYDIYGARVSPSATVLDSEGILISICANSQDYPSVAYGEAEYLVVWHDNRSSSNDIYCGMVNQAGSVLTPYGIPIASDANDLQHPAVVFSDTNYLVVWENAQAGAEDDIYGARMNQSGVLLDTVHIAISTAESKQAYPAVVTDGTAYFVVWHDSRSSSYDIYSTRVSQSGTVFDPGGVAISSAPNSQMLPSAAFGGTTYLVVWADSRNDPGNYSNTDIYAARVTQSGIVIDTHGIAVSTAIKNQTHPAVAFDGTNYFVVWEDWRNVQPFYDTPDIYATRISQNGIVLDPYGIPISTAEQFQGQPCVAFGSTEFLVIWQDNRNGLSHDLYGARVSSLGSVVDSFAVSLQHGNQLRPQIAHGAESQFLITFSGWTDSINLQACHAKHIWGKFYPFVGIEEHGELQKHATLVTLNIYPNIIRRKCRIVYSVPSKSLVSISIFDATGRFIEELITGHHAVGLHSEIIDISDLAQGVYFVKLNTEDNSVIQKVVLVR